jgi:hypothetical protein
VFDKAHLEQAHDGVYLAETLEKGVELAQGLAQKALESTARARG